MTLTIEQWDNKQIRAVDPFRTEEANAVNRLSRVLTLGEDAVLDLENANCVLKDYKTVTAVACHYSKDDVYIHIEEDVDIDFTDLDNYWSLTNRGMNIAGTYHVVLHYVYAESEPQPVAEILIVKDETELTDHVIRLCNAHVTWNTTNLRYEIDSIDFDQVPYILVRSLYAKNGSTNLLAKLTELRLTATEPPTDSANFAGGRIIDKPNKEMITVPSQSVGPFPVVSANNLKRYDLVSIKFDGSLVVHTGPEVSILDSLDTSIMTLPADEYLVALVLINESDFVLVEDRDIIDARDFINTPYWLESKIDDIINQLLALGNFMGPLDASAGTLPTVGSGSGNSISKGDNWRITVGGTLPDVGPVQIGDILMASVANPASTDWFVIDANANDMVTSSSIPAVNKDLAMFDGTSGTIITDSGIATDDVKNLLLPAGAKVYSGGVEITELSVTGAASTIITDNLTPERVAISNNLGKMAASNITLLELGTLDGIDTSQTIQEQIDNSALTVTGAASTIINDNLTASRALVSDGSGKVAVSAVTLEELASLDDIHHDDLVLKRPIYQKLALKLDNSFTPSRVLVSDSSGKGGTSTITSTELSQLSGVSSNIQTQFTNKQNLITGAASSVTVNDLSANKAVITDSNGKLAAHGSVTSTEVSYLSGTTNNIQDQINNLSGMSGEVTCPGNGTNSPIITIPTPSNTYTVQLTIRHLGSEAATVGELSYYKLNTTQFVIQNSGSNTTSKIAYHVYL